MTSHGLSFKVPPKVEDHKGALLDIILKMKNMKKMKMDADAEAREKNEIGYENENEDMNDNENKKFMDTKNSENEDGCDKNGSNECLDSIYSIASIASNECIRCLDSNDSNEETDLSISTITATGSVGCNIDMASFYYNTVIDDICDDTIKRDGFTYIEWGQKGQDTLCRGLHKKMTIKHKRIKEGKRFDKQITVILRKYDAEHDTYLYQNLKIFYNGMIQMTGLKSCEQGEWVLKYMIDTLKKIKNEKSCHIFDDDLGFFGSYALVPHDYSIRLINSNFRLGYAVNRRVLCNFLNMNNIYNVFEASRYPGVKIPFYWNSSKSQQDGVCSCADQMCTKITKAEKKYDSMQPTGGYHYSSNDTDDTNDTGDTVITVNTNDMMDKDDKDDKAVMTHMTNTTDTTHTTSLNMNSRDVKRYQSKNKEIRRDTCHKTTIIVFQSGSIIITGGQSMKQIYDAYDFIKAIFERIRDDVKKPFTRTKYSKTYPKFSYNNINERKKKSIKLPQGYKYDQPTKENKNEKISD